MSAYYESRRLSGEYLLFHFGIPSDIFELPEAQDTSHLHGFTGFASRLIDVLLDENRVSVPSRCLDVGCAVGGSSFALASRGHRVLGIDFSSVFIHAANSLKETGGHDVQIAVEGDRCRPFAARIDPGIDRSLVEFRVGDAQALPADIGRFDVVVAANLLCRLPHPRRFLAALPGLLAPGGQLLLTTPFSWLEEFTQRQNWIGGNEGDAPCFDLLRDLLAPHFDLELRIGIPMLLREHSRKFQLTFPCGSRWIRKASDP